MNKKLLLVSSVCSLGVSAAAMAGGADHMAPAVAAPLAPVAASPFFAGLEGGYSLPRGNYEAYYDNEKAGEVKLSDTFADSFTFAGYVGYKLPNMPLDVEIEGRYTDLGKSSATTTHDFNLEKQNYRVSTTDTDSSLWNVMFNAVYNFDLGGHIEPFIGAGIGYAHMSSDITVTPTGGSANKGTASGGGMAYQGFVGLAYNVSQSVSVYICYNILGTTLEIKNPHLVVADTNIKGLDYRFSKAMFHSINAGLEFNF